VPRPTRDVMSDRPHVRAPRRPADGRESLPTPERRRASSLPECAASIRRQAAGRFPGLGLCRGLETGADGPPESRARVTARGRPVGHLQAITRI
jgi:hypothetical protein